MSDVTARPEDIRGDVPGDSFDSGDPSGGSADDPYPVQRRGDQPPDQPPDDEPRLTVAAVARRLGVAPATLRTWDRRYGLGPSGHASGKHRRYGPGDIARLEQMQRALLRGASPAEAARYAHSHATREAPAPAAELSSGVADEGDDAPLMMSGVLETGGEEIEEIDVSAPSTGGRGLKLTGAAPAARGLGRAALSLDSWSAQQLLLESVRDEGVIATWTSMLQPVLGAIAERRRRTGADAEVLQLLTDCASTALRSVIAGAPVPINPRPVVLAPVPGEAQELELVALAAALAAGGVGHRLYGAALPREALAAAVRRSAPAAVVLWSEQAPFAAPGVLDDIPVTRQRSRVFLGGAGWSAGSMPPHVELLGGFEAAVDRIRSAVLD